MVTHSPATITGLKILVLGTPKPDSDGLTELIDR
jgi:hypothetical protein